MSSDLCADIIFRVLTRLWLLVLIFLLLFAKDSLSAPSSSPSLSDGSELEEVSGSRATFSTELFYESSTEDSLSDSDERFVSNISSSSLESSQSLARDIVSCSKRIALDVFNPWAVVASPNYPEAYPSDIQCNIIISSSGDNFDLELLFTDFQLQDDERCASDYVEITTWAEQGQPSREQGEEPSSETTRYCGDWSGKIKLLRKINKNNIGLYIKTDSSLNFKGFRAEVRLLKGKNRTLPTRQELASSGEESAGVSTVAKDERLCDNQWFTLFEEGCFLVSAFPEVSWFTARRICSDIESQLLFIRNSSDEETLARLLDSALYQANNDLSRPSRLFWLQHSNLAYAMGQPVYGSQEEDNWSDEWYAGGDDEKEHIDSSMQFQGKSQESSTTISSDSTLRPPVPLALKTIASLSQSMPCVAAMSAREDGHKRVLYERLGCKQQAGYICVKKPLDLRESSNRSITNTQSGQLKSPNYPHSYPNSVHYTVDITTSPGSLIVVWFELFDLEFQSQCLYDYLTLSERVSGATSGRLCGTPENSGNLRNYTYFSRGNEARLEFHSDFANRGKGFVANWRELDLSWCRQEHHHDPVTLTDSKNGSVQSPGYPDWVVPSLNCTINIRAPDGQRVLLTLIDFDFGVVPKTPKMDKCASASTAASSAAGLGFGAQVNVDKLSLSLGDEKSITLCGSMSARDYHDGQHFMSYGNHLSMNLVTRSWNFGEMISVKRGFRFKYDFIPREGILTTVLKLTPGGLGSITSLNYPFVAPMLVENMIYLRTAVGSTIELRASKLLYSYLIEGECAPGQESLLSITDHFGNISLYPPTASTWSVCRRVDDFVGQQKQHQAEQRIRKSVRGQYSNYANRLKAIQSTFHSLAVRSLSISPQPVRYFTPTFQFFYKTVRDEKFLNKSIPLPSKYPLDTCVYSPCAENGVCRLRRYSKNQTINQCVCKTHWTGLFCHLTLCEKNPCGERGLCKLDKNSNNFICHCNTGYTGKNCGDTLEKCDRHNPCRDRGKCALINGIPTCSCQPWYEGKYCERFRYKMQYKPLSQRMLEEPFWLGLIAVLSVLAVISLVYCIKNMFSERIEKFFAEEIERSKAMSYSFAEPGSAPRYSLTSNVGLSINLTANNSPLPRSRSSIIGKLRKSRFSKGRGGGHMSDSEVFQSRDGRTEDNSDAESTSFDKGKIFARLVGRGFKREDRRLSLSVMDDFKNIGRATESKKVVRPKRFLDIDTFGDYDRHSLTSTLSETSFMAPQSPVERTIPTIAEFHVITENSLEDQDSVQSGGKSPSNPHVHVESSTSLDNASLSDRLPHVLKQESEAESLLKSIRKIQRVSNIEMSSYSEEEEVQRQGTGNRSTSPRPRLSRPPSGFSSSSSESQLLCSIPEITITTASIEYDRNGSHTIGGEAPPVGGQTKTGNQGVCDQELAGYSECIEGEKFSGKAAPGAADDGSGSGDCNMMMAKIPDHLRRSSVPIPLSEDTTNRYCSASSMSCDTPIQRVLAGQVARKHSLELSVPKITIVSGEGTSSTAKGMNVRSDRTISESNLSTSGYSSLSSPGISRCSSSSPIHEEIHTVVIPPAGGFADAELSMHSTTAVMAGCRPFAGPPKPRGFSTYGNFLTIPNITYPMAHQHQHQHHHSPTSSPKVPKPGMHPISEQGQVFNFDRPSTTGGISRRASQESRDEGIDLNEATSPRLRPCSPSIQSKRGRLVAMRQQHATVDPGGVVANEQRTQFSFKNIQNSKSFEGFFENDNRHQGHSECRSEVERVRRPPRDRSPTISRQPSWPGLLHPPPEASPSSDSEVDTVLEKDKERQLMLLKRFERRRHGSNTSLNSKDGASAERRSQFRSRSRSPLAFSQSIDIASGTGRQPEKHYQRCSSSRSLCTAIYMDDSATSSSSDSIPSSLNEDEPVTIRSAKSLNTINLPASRFASTTTAAERQPPPVKRKIGLKDKILLKMRTHSHSLPASPQLPDVLLEEHPATAAASLAALPCDPSTLAATASSGNCSRGNSIRDSSESSNVSERCSLLNSRRSKAPLAKQKKSMDYGL